MHVADSRPAKFGNPITQLRHIEAFKIIFSTWVLKNFIIVNIVEISKRHMPTAVLSILTSRLCVLGTTVIVGCQGETISGAETFQSLHPITETLNAAVNKFKCWVRQ